MNTHPEFIQAPVAFLNDEWRYLEGLPRIFSRETRHANTTRRDVIIHNARIRQEAGELDLDSNGFIIVNHKTTFTDYRSKDAVHGQYFPEMRE
ncbi:MAG: hypothetical protein AAF512_14355, partial [Pseudomonadota bacterium]